MTDERLPPAPDDGLPLMDELLREGVPAFKLALGEAIDRENSRPLPPRYARLLPDTLLVVALRADAAAALSPVVPDLERELTDSCNRHGSLYDRSYRVQLRRTDDPDAPLYSVTTHAGRDLAAASGAIPDEAARSEESAALPLSDPEATRIDAISSSGWEAGRWVLVVEGEGGEEREAFRIADPLVTVGRRSDDPGLRAAIAISDAPHVSRRQLALLWEERDGAPGFRVYNLGLNSVHLPALEVAGADLGKRALDLGAIPEENTGWLPPGVPLRIGDGGPVLRVEEVPDEDAGEDPEATVFE
jgi:hypothetical protein